jgi:hypothetical protein
MLAHTWRAARSRHTCGAEATPRRRPRGGGRRVAPDKPPAHGDAGAAESKARPSSPEAAAMHAIHRFLVSACARRGHSHGAGSKARNAAQARRAFAENGIYVVHLRNGSSSSTPRQERYRLTSGGRRRPGLRGGQCGQTASSTWRCRPARSHQRDARVRLPQADPIPMPSSAPGAVRGDQRALDAEGPHGLSRAHGQTHAST